MAAITADVIVDRIRSVCAGVPFGMVEAVAWTTFELQPTTNLDNVFRIPPPSSQRAIPMFGYAEERTDSVQIWLARKHNQDFDGVRRALTQTVHSLTAAITRDAFQDSGEYNVPSDGRGHSIFLDRRTDEFLTLRLTLPVNYDAQL